MCNYSEPFLVRNALMTANEKKIAQFHQKLVKNGQSREDRLYDTLHLYARLIELAVKNKHLY